MSIQKNRIFEAGAIIRSGGIAIVPTETFYCIAADPLNDHAIERIFSLKKRVEAKPVALIASERGAIDKIVSPPSSIQNFFMNTFWPGSLTLLFQPSRQLNHHLLGPTNKVGIRVSPDKTARETARTAGELMTATSANLSGGKDPCSISEIPRDIIHSVDYVLDGGITPGGKPSSVIDFIQNEPIIIREGAISSEEILAAQCKWKELGKLYGQFLDLDGY